MKRVTTIGLYAAPWLPPPRTNAAASTPAGCHARGSSERLLVDAYYPLLDFSDRLLTASEDFPPPMPLTMPCCFARYASFQPMRVPLPPFSVASLLTCKA